MKTKSIVSLLFLLAVSVLYFFGVCEIEFPVYIICVIVVLGSMIIFIRQEKKYGTLVDKKNNLEQELKKYSSD